MPKCLLCFSEEVYDTHSDYTPFACANCGAWGEKADDVSNLPDDDYREAGQVERRLTDDHEDSHWSRRSHVGV